MGFSAMLAEEYILVDISLISCIMVRLFFATSLKFIQLQHFYLSLVTGLTNHRISAQQKALTRWLQA
jgi:hypothetical protein